METVVILVAPVGTRSFYLSKLVWLRNFQDTDSVFPGGVSPAKSWKTLKEFFLSYLFT